MSALRWALLGAAWGAVGPALQSGLRAPEVDPSRFFIDYAYLRRDYPCSPEERRCFDFGRLLHPSDGRPCAGGWVALASDRRCHPLRELRSMLCAGEVLLYDVLGFVACAPAPAPAAALPAELPARRTADGRCVMDRDAPRPPPLYVLRPEDDPE